MKINFLLHFLFLSFILFSCKNSERRKDAENKIIIDIQPFSDFNEADLKTIETELQKVYTNIEIKASIPFPKSSFIKDKTRYRADSIIDYLSRITKSGHLTIGLTNKDICTRKNNFNEWGIMGLGFCPGKSCVASSFRLKSNKKLAQLFKVAIHELGHTQGLPHCPVKTCFMRDAEGKNYTDQETEFCETCKAVLIKAGWMLK